MKKPWIRTFCRSALSGSRLFVVLMGLFFSACSSYGPAPPILVPDPSVPPPQATGAARSPEIIHVLPTQLPKDMEDIGTLFKNDGSYSQLVSENPLGPVLDAILIKDLRAGGIQAVLAHGALPPDAPTLQIVVQTFQDKIKENFLNTSQEAKVRMEATLILHRGTTTRTIMRSMERRSSPKPVMSFNKNLAPRLLGSLYSTSIRQDLVPFLLNKMGESP